MAVLNSSNGTPPRLASVDPGATLVEVEAAAAAVALWIRRRNCLKGSVGCVSHGSWARGGGGGAAGEASRSASPTGPLARWATKAMAARSRVTANHPCDWSSNMVKMAATSRVSSSLKSFGKWRGPCFFLAVAAAIAGIVRVLVRFVST